MLSRHFKRKAEGKCAGCGKMAQDGKSRCVPCSEKFNAYMSNFYKQKRQDGLCVTCGDKAIHLNQYCKKHWFMRSENGKIKSFKNVDKNKAYSKKRRKQLKEEGKCTQCGLTLNREYEPYTKCINCLELTHKPF